MLVIHQARPCVNDFIEYPNHVLSFRHLLSRASDAAGDESLRFLAHSTFSDVGRIVDDHQSDPTHGVLFIYMCQADMITLLDVPDPSNIERDQLDVYVANCAKRHVYAVASVMPDLGEGNGHLIMVTAKTWTSAARLTPELDLVNCSIDYEASVTKAEASLGPLPAARVVPKFHRLLIDSSMSGAHPPEGS